MHKRFDLIRKHLKETYSVPGDVLEAIMQDTLEMAKNFPKLKLVATIRDGEEKPFFEISESFNPNDFKDGEKLVLKDEQVVGSMKVSMGRDGIINSIESEMEAELSDFPINTQIFVLR